MISKKAEEYLKHQYECYKDNEMKGNIVADDYNQYARQAVELAEEELKQRAIDAFDEFVRQYCCDCNIHQISDDADHYLKVFEKLISNKPNELE